MIRIAKRILDFIKTQRKTLKYIIIFFVVTMALLGVSFGTKSVHSGGDFYSFYKPQRDVMFNIVDKIEEGIAMLKSSPPLIFETTSGRENGSVTKKQIALAILNLRTGELREQRVWANEAEIREASTSGVVNLTPDNPNENDADVYVGWWNSFNTVYEIPENPDMVVVANKYLISRQYLPEQTYLALIDNGPEDKYTSMVYAPYSQRLHWPEVVQEGKDYLNKHIELAFKSLKELEVKSLAEPDNLVANTVSKNLIRNIVIIEHIDPTLLAFASDGGRLLAERVLVILGSNKEWAYRYTGSGAGASGMAQFIRSTYEHMIELYPNAGLIEDYSLGMADHTNAVKAMALFLDSHKEQLQDSISDKYIKQLGITDEMLSAVYNGGPGRVINAVNALGERWTQSNLFPDETSNYVKKYDIIKALELF